MKKIYGIWDWSYCLVFNANNIDDYNGTVIKHGWRDDYINNNEWAIVSMGEFPGPRPSLCHEDTSNNVLLRNIHNGDYMFSRREFLFEIDKPKYCKECGHELR